MLDYAVVGPRGGMSTSPDPGAKGGAGGEPSSAARVHRHLVQGLIVLASIIGTLAVFAVWLDRQALDTNEWTKTSNRLLENGKVRGVLSDYLVARLYANVDVSRELAQLLPRRERALAGPAADGLKVVATQAIQRGLATPPVEDLFRQANREAHRALLAVIDGREQAISAANGTVSLDLSGLLAHFGGSQVAGIAVAPGTASVAILHSDQLETVQLAAHVIRDLVVVLVAPRSRAVRRRGGPGPRLAPHRAAQRRHQRDRHRHRRTGRPRRDRPIRGRPTRP